MTKRDLPPPASDTRQRAKLISTCDGELFVYTEPSLVCAAQHALSMLDCEEGCVHRIEVDGKIVWRFNPARPRESVGELEDLATSDDCRK